MRTKRLVLLMVLALMTSAISGCYYGDRHVFVNEFVDGYTASGRVTDQVTGQAIPGVVISFKGGFPSVTTDSYGNWVAPNLRGTMTLTPELEGWIFNPPSAAVSDQWSVTAVNFVGTRISPPLP